MKRMMAMCLATMMILSLALVGYGDEHDGSTDVILEISDRYVTTIPAQVSFGNTMEIKVSEKASSDEVVVFVSSLNYINRVVFKRFLNICSKPIKNISILSILIFFF